MHPVNHIKEGETEREEVPVKLNLGIFSHFLDRPGTAVNLRDRIKRPASQEGCSFSLLPESETVSSTNSPFNGKQLPIDPLRQTFSIWGRPISNSDP